MTATLARDRCQVIRVSLSYWGSCGGRRRPVSVLHQPLWLSSPTEAASTWCGAALSTGSTISHVSTRVASTYLALARGGLVSTYFSWSCLNVLPKCRQRAGKTWLAKINKETISFSGHNVFSYAELFQKICPFIKCTHQSCKFPLKWGSMPSWSTVMGYT